MAKGSGVPCALRTRAGFLRRLGVGGAACWMRVAVLKARKNDRYA